MRVLLDTHAFLWWVTDDERLTGTAREAIGAADQVFVSSASVWEMVTKSKLGRLPTPRPIHEFVPAQLDVNAFQPLAIEVRHALQLSELPDLHRDPFDRMLVAQARAEDLPLVSGDRAIHAYPVTTIW